MIVVTGGAGFIGSNIVAALNDAGRRDVVVSDLLRSDGKWQNLRKRMVLDIVPPDALMDWLGARSDIEAVIHMGANSSTRSEDGDDVVRRNVRFTLGLVDWCTARRVRLIYASSAATYGAGEQGFADGFDPGRLDALRPRNLYGWSKHLVDRILADRVARGDKLPPLLIGLKLFNVFGPNEYHKGEQQSVAAKFFEPIRRGEPARLFKSGRPDVADGAQARDFVAVEDVAAVVCYLLTLTSGCDLVNVGTGRARSFHDLAGAIFDALDLPRRIEFVEMPDALRGHYQYFTEADIGRLRALGFDAPMTALEPAITRFVRDHLTATDPYR